MFTHKRAGKPDHQHETVAEARRCEVDRFADAKHQDPCVCGPYDMCRDFRVASRQRFKAFND